MNTIACIAAVVMLIQGQPPSAPPPISPAAEAPANTFTGLAEPILDGSYGYTVRPPTGWQVRRIRSRVGSAVTLVEMLERIGPYQSHTLSVQRTTGLEGEKIDAVLQRYFEGIASAFNESTVEAPRPRTISGKPGLSIAATYMADGEKTLRLQAGVEVRPQQYLMLLYQGPASMRSTVEPLFDRVLDSLALVPDAYDANALRAAGEEGIVWLKNVGGSSLKKALVPETYFRVESEGKVVGFMAVMEKETEHDSRPGIEVRERFWTFSPDGIVQRIQTNAFISLDLSNEDWKDSFCTLIPGKGDQPNRMLATLEEAVRVDHTLLSTQAYSLDQGSTANPPFELPPTYLSRPIARMFPRLTSRLDKPRLIALGIFDQARSDIVMRIVELKGEEAVPGGSKRQGPTYRIDQRDGPASPASSTWVDENGIVLLIKLGSMTMRPTTRDAVERLFTDKILKAEKAMAAEEAKYHKESGRFNVNNPGKSASNTDKKPVKKPVPRKPAPAPRKPARKPPK